MILQSQSLLDSYVTSQPRPQILTQELLDQNIFNWAIGTMQPFTMFDNSLFQQIWLDLPGISCKYGSSASFSRCVDEEFGKARMQLKKKLKETCSTIALSLDEWKSQNGYKIFAIIDH